MNTPAQKPERQPAEGSRASAIAKGTQFLRAFSSDDVAPVALLAKKDRDEFEEVPFGPTISLTDARSVLFMSDGKGLAIVKETTKDTAQANIDAIGVDPSAIVRAGDGRIALIWRFAAPQKPDDNAARLIRAFTGREWDNQCAPIPGFAGADYQYVEDESTAHAEGGFPAYAFDDLMGHIEKVVAASSAEGVAIEPEGTAAVSQSGEALERPATPHTGPFKHKDAEFVGGDLPAKVLDLPLKIGFGRSRDDKRWPPKPIKFEQMLSMLIVHEPDDKKDGHAFIQGEAIKNERKARAIKGLYVVGLDVDSGIKLDWIVNRLQNDLKLTSIIYTTHSNDSTETTILQASYQKAAKKLGLPIDPTHESMREYMRRVKKWELWIVDTITVEEDLRHDSDGMMYVLHHSPIPKFRIIFPLLEPYIIAKQKGLNQSDAIDRWKGKLLGLAKTIGLPIDESCLDPSRLFYLPRHPKGADFAIYVTSGAALNFDNVPEVERRRDTGPIDDDVFAAAAADLGASSGLAIEIPNYNLRFWAKHNAGQFDICKLFADKMPERIRQQVNQDKFEVECPFDDNHSNQGDTDDRACYVISAHADNSDSPFQWGCQHASCKNRDRLEFVAKATNDGWFTTADLEDKSHMIFTVEGEPEVKKDPNKLADTIITDFGDSDGKDAKWFEDRIHEAVDAGVGVPKKILILNALKSRHPIFPRKAGVACWDARVANKERKEREKQETARKKVDASLRLPVAYIREGGMIRYLGGDDGPEDVCAEFWVEGELYDEQDHDWHMLISFNGPNGKRQIAVPMEQLHGEPSKLRAHLMKSGLRIYATRKAKEHFDGLISKLETKARKLRATRAAWHEWEGRTVYLSPTGEARDEKGVCADVMLAAHVRMKRHKPRGSLDKWREAVRAAAGSKHWLWPFFLATAGGGAIITLCGKPNMGANICGETSIGKSTGQRYAASFYGDPAPGHGLLSPMDFTANSLENLMARAHGSTFQGDELKNVKPDQLAAVTFKVANGTSKARQTGSEGLREGMEWQTLWTTTSELAAQHIIEGTDQQALRGGSVRLLDISVSDMPDVPQSVRDKLALCESNYGHGWRLYIDRLYAAGYVKDREKLRSEITSLVDCVCGENAPGRIRRAAETIAVIWKSGEVMLEAGIPFVLGDTLDAQKTELGNVMRSAWKATLIMSDDAVLDPAQQNIAKIRSAFQRNLHSRFVPLTAIDDAPNYVRGEVWGWFTEETIHIPRAALGEITGEDHGVVASRLAEVGVLEKRKSGHLFHEKVPGRGKEPNYRLRRKVLIGDDPKAFEESDGDE